MVSRPAWYRDHFFGLGLGLGLTVIGPGLGLGLMKYWSWSHTLWSRLRKVHFQLLCAILCRNQFTLNDTRCNTGQHRS